MTHPALLLLVSLLPVLPADIGKDLARADTFRERYGKAPNVDVARRWRPQIAALIERLKRHGGPAVVHAISGFCRYADLDEYTVTALLALDTEDSKRIIYQLFERPDPGPSTPSGLQAHCRRADLMRRFNELSRIAPAAVLGKVLARDPHRQAMEAALRDLSRRTGREATSAVLDAVEEATPEAAVTRLRSPQREDVFIYLVVKNLRLAGDGPRDSEPQEPKLLRDLEDTAATSPIGGEEKLDPAVIARVYDRLMALATGSQPDWKRLVALRVLKIQGSKRRLEAMEKILVDAESPSGILQEAVRIAIELGDPKAGRCLAPVVERWLKTPGLDIDDVAALIAAIFPLRIPGMESYLLAAADSKDELLRAAAIQSLPILGEEAVQGRIVRALKDSHWRIRHAAIVACGRLRSATAVDLLISQMRREKGRLRVPLLRTLRTLTGVEMGYEPDDWKKWWEPARGAFRPHAGGAEPVGRTRLAFPEFTRTNYFGIDVFSSRLCFVVDVSGSMGGQLQYEGEIKSRIEVVIAQLFEIIDALNDRTSFNIFFFSSTYRKLFPRLAPTNRTNVRTAKSFVAAARAEGSTNLSKPLADALLDRSVDTIFVLSDGRPDSSPDEILGMVARLNSKRGIQINAIAIGEDSEFLRKLAARNLGEYRHYE